MNGAEVFMVTINKKPQPFHREGEVGGTSMYLYKFSSAFFTLPALIIISFTCE